MTRTSCGNLVVIHSCLALRVKSKGWRRLIGCCMSFSANEPLIVGHSCLGLRVRSSGWRRLIGCGMPFPAKQLLRIGLSWWALKARGTGWRRLIGSLKSQVLCCNRATNYRALLRKMTYKNKVSCDSTPPCRGMYLFLSDSLCSSLFLSHSVFLHLSLTRFFSIHVFLYKYRVRDWWILELDASLTFSFFPFSIYVCIQYRVICI